MSRPLELAESYMKSFFGQAPLEMMSALFAVDLEFEGPFYQSSTAKQYMDRLREDPPVDVHYVMERAYEDQNSACLIYLFSKTGVETRMVQTFEIADDKIQKIRLLFDTNAFT